MPHARLAVAQVRAGEGQAEAAGTVLTNPVWKQSTYASLSTRGRAQARARSGRPAHPPPGSAGRAPLAARAAGTRYLLPLLAASSQGRARPCHAARL
jgi:hypothetical protein